MPKVDIWMPIYIGDYLRDTEELTGPEHGAYLLLLMHYWQKKGEIGCNVERLARVARSEVETARFILGYYFELIDGNYKNNRADEEMKKAQSRRESAIENGKKGGRPHKINPQKTNWFSTDNRPVSQTKPEANPRKSSSSSPSPSYKEIKEYNVAYLDLISLMLELMERNDSNVFHGKNKEAVKKRWYDDIRKLVEIDGRAVEDITRIIRWVYDDSFWKGNILSAKKLREKYPTLLMQSERGVKNQTQEKKYTREDYTRGFEGVM